MLWSWPWGTRGALRRLWVEQWGVLGYMRPLMDTYIHVCTHVHRCMCIYKDICLHIFFKVAKRIFCATLTSAGTMHDLRAEKRALTNGYNATIMHMCIYAGVGFGQNGLDLDRVD